MVAPSPFAVPGSRVAPRQAQPVSGHAVAALASDGRAATGAVTFDQQALSRLLDLRERHRELDGIRLRAIGNAEQLARQHADNMRAIKEGYGVETIEELRSWFAEQRDENISRIDAYQERIEAVQQAIAAVENTVETA
jgi:flagellar biosynthesis chaperone FliJ